MAIINFVISVIPNKKLQSRLLPITHLLLKFLSNKNGPQSVSPYQHEINSKNTHLINFQIPPNKCLPKRLPKHPVILKRFPCLLSTQRQPLRDPTPHPLLLLHLRRRLPFSMGTTIPHLKCSVGFHTALHSSRDKPRERQIRIRSPIYAFHSKVPGGGRGGVTKPDRSLAVIGPPANVGAP